jgi:hypothetical protein
MYLLHFVITPKQHKTQGKESSISYEFTILFVILVHNGLYKRLHVYYFKKVVAELHENIMQIICMMFYDKSIMVYYALNVFQLSEFTSTYSI